MTSGDAIASAPAFACTPANAATGASPNVRFHTAAHRPTIVPAKGHEEQGGMRIFAPSRMQSAKDVAAHTKLKFR